MILKFVHENSIVKSNKKKKEIILVPRAFFTLLVFLSQRAMGTRMWEMIFTLCLPVL